MDRDRYVRLHEYFEGHPGSARALNLVCGVLTMAVYSFFVFLIAYELVAGEYRVTYEILLVCGVGFIACSVVRKIINSPRPYEVYELPSTIKRSKSGCSFPSRHVFSIAIIAVAAWRVSPAAGAVLVVLTLVLAATRVLGGVHFIKDAAAGALLAFFWGAGGFYILSIV